MVNTNESHDADFEQLVLEYAIFRGVRRCAGYFMASLL